MNQHPYIVYVDEIKNKKEMPLTLDYMLFVGTHVQDIVVSRNQNKFVDGNSSHLSKSTKNDVLLELNEVSKSIKKWSYQAP